MPGTRMPLICEEHIQMFYRNFLKRFFDILLSFLALAVLSPVLIILTVTGAAAMRGNPFFVQERPGRRKKNPDGTWGQERNFRLIKFRSMNCRKDSEGRLLPDDLRLTGYGRKLRSTSLDELPELINILIGDMSIVGPRPLLVQYLDRYSEEQRHRQDVRPGLTGWAQVNGRNAVTWQERFEMDVWYTRNASLGLDVKIMFMTVGAVLGHKGISSEGTATMEEFMGNAKNTEEQ